MGLVLKVELLVWKLFIILQLVGMASLHNLWIGDISKTELVETVHESKLDAVIKRKMN